MKRSVLLAAGLLVLLAIPVTGQEAPAVRPGTLVTLPLRLPHDIAERAAAGDSVAYTIRPASGFRAVGSPDRVLDYRSGDTPIVPITLSVPGDAPAGAQEAAVVVFRAGSGQDSVRAMLTVAAETGLTVTLEAVEPEARPGGTLQMTYEIINRGNRADTVVLALNTRLGEHDLDPTPVPVPAFSSIRGTFRVYVSADARPGSSDNLLLQSNGTASVAFDRVEIPITRSTGAFDGLVRIPASILVGSSVTRSGASPVLAFEAGGQIRPGTSLLIQAHHVDQQSSGFAFRGLQFGPKFRAQLASQRLTATVGDLFTRISPMTGYALAGRGAEASVRFGRVTVGGHAAKPADPAGNVVDGSQFAAGVEVATRAGALGFQALSERRENQSFSPSLDTRAGLLQFGSRPRSDHQIEVEAGYMALQNLDSGQQDAGLAASGRYAYRGRRFTGDVVGRWRPTVQGDRGLAPREVRGAASIWASGTVGFSGQAYYVQNPSTPLVPVESATAGEAGIYYAARGTRLDLRGRFRRSKSFVTVDERTIEGSYTGLLGIGSVDARAEVGSTRSAGVTRSILRLRGGYSLRGPSGWGRIGLNYFDDVFSPGSLSLDLGGSYRVSRLLEVYGTVGTYLTRFDLSESLVARVGAQWNLTRSFVVYTALESLETGIGEGMRLSVGAQKGLPLPLPVSREAAVHGTVFDDLNGNGRLDEGEETVDGIRLLMGSERASSRAGGRFEFLSDVPRGMVEIDQSSLGSGYLPQGPMLVPSKGRLDVALHRPATIRSVAFLDLNGNETWDPTEPPVRDAELIITGAEGSTWALRTSGDGSVVLNSIRPGTYTLSIDPASLPRRAEPPALLRVDLKGGEQANVAIPVPARRIELRRVAGNLTDSTAVEAPTEGAAIPTREGDPAHTAPAPVDAAVTPLELESEATIVAVAPKAIPAAPRAIPLVTPDEQLEHADPELGGIPVVDLGALAVLDIAVPRLDAAPESETVQPVPVRVLPIDRPQPLVVAAVDPEAEAPIVPIAADALAPAEPLAPEFAGALLVETYYDANGNGIRDEGEEHAAGIEVTITRGDEEWRFRTGIDGTTSLTPVPVGIYIVSAISRAFADLGAQPGIFPIRVDSVRQTVIRLPVPVRVDLFQADDDDDDD